MFSSESKQRALACCDAIKWWQSSLVRNECDGAEYSSAASGRVWSPMLSERRKKDKCFRCFSYFVLIPYKLLVITIFFFPFICLFMMIAGPLCK